MAVVFLATGVILFLIALNIEKKMWASKNWPFVKGKIIKSNFTASPGNARNYSHYYTPQILYNYTVNGKDYISEKIALGTKDSVKASKIYERYLDRYPKDKVVDIYYDPANPKLAVLEPGINKGNAWYYLLSVLSVLCGIFLLINFFTGFGDSFIEDNFCSE